jgi:acetyl-CoA carboxylase, biotin carboxylase subunit
VRLDTHLEDGGVVPPYYDSLLGKLIVWNDDRQGAIARALRALGELAVEGVPTTRETAIEILRSEEFASGRYSTTFLAEAAPRLATLRAG